MMVYLPNPNIIYANAFPMQLSTAQLKNSHMINNVYVYTKHYLKRYALILVCCSLSSCHRPVFREIAFPQWVTINGSPKRLL